MRTRPSPAARAAARCGRCLFPRCLCPEVPHVVTRTRFVIVRHASERHRSSNTGRLAALALANSELWEYGAPDAPFDAAVLEGEGGWLLYPGGGPAGEGAPGWPPRRVIVLDGTWPQARRMWQRIGALRRLPLLSLPPPQVAPPRLRRAPEPAQMTTLEAMARALAVLEGEALARPLEALHAAAVRVARELGRLDGPAPAR